MKLMKKLIAALLPLIMTLSMATGIMAENKPADLTNHTFTAYQIFSANSISEGKELGNIEWGSAVSEDTQKVLLDAVGLLATASAQDFAEKLHAMVNDSADAKRIARIAYDNIVTPGTVEGEDVVNGETVLDYGYYLIVDTTVFAEGTTEPLETVYNLSLLKVSDNKTPVTITNKTDVPSVDKEILDPTEMKTNEAGIGEVVNYKITGTLPSNYADYKGYYYWFTDTLSKGLTYNGDAKVYVVNGETATDVTSQFYRSATDYDADNGTVIDVAHENLKSVTGVEITSSSLIVVKYSATVNENAVIASTGNPNKVDLEYSNNPDKSGEGDRDEDDNDKPITTHPTGKTPESKVVTYVTELKIKKTDEQGNILPGVEFELKGTNLVSVKLTTGTAYVEDAEGTYWKLKDGTYTTEAPKDDVYENNELTFKNNHADYDSTTKKYKAVTGTKVDSVDASDTEKKVTATVAADGTITFTGLTVGEYTLTETVTPDGYNTIAPIKFTVTWDPDTKLFGIAEAESPITVEATNKLYTEVVNMKGTTLPETGGMGTTLFYVAGGLMMVGAAVLLITKKRMEA